jgi:peptidoglycan hydrolase-like protein with peptidoglycan-binding domain
VPSRAASRARRGYDDERFITRLCAALLHAVLQRPKESIALIAVVAATGAILVNALFLQSGPHPAPFFATQTRPLARVETTGTLSVLPRPRPADAPAARSRTEIVTDIQRELARRGFYEGAPDGVYGPKTDAAIRDFEQVSGLKIATEPAEIVLKTISQSSAKAAPPPAPTPSSAAATPARNEATAEMIGPSKRVLAVQRALADFGYGQIKSTGVLNPETQAAIEKFERDRKLPITGQMSERLARELSAMTGRPLE